MAVVFASCTQYQSLMSRSCTNCKDARADTKFETKDLYIDTTLHKISIVCIHTDLYHKSINFIGFYNIYYPLMI